MENTKKKRILEKIKSKEILKTIFNYIKNNYNYKLFTYSKYFQKKLDINLVDYQEKYIGQTVFNPVNIYHLTISLLKMLIKII